MYSFSHFSLFIAATSVRADVSSELSGGSRSYELPIHAPLVQTLLGGGALKGSKTPGDLVSFIPFNSLKSIIEGLCPETLLVPGRLGDQDG